jgi:hypothetical protein
MLIDLEGAHAFYVSIFGRVEHLRGFQRLPKNSTSTVATVASFDPQSSL